MQALHYYERALCPCGCGQPARVSQNERFRGMFSKERTICHARVELERGEKDRERPSGELQWVEFDLDWRRSFPSA